MPLLAVGLMCAQPLSSISGWVETASGDRLKHVMLRINNAGGKETTDTGEFSMPLPSGLGPGDPVVFYVDEYIVQDPYVGKPGRMFLPKQRIDPIEIRVARKGDAKALSETSSVGSLMREFGYASVSLAPDQFPVTTFDSYLAIKAKEYSVDSKQLSMAVDRWDRTAKDAYSQGLAALAKQDFPKASANMRQSIEQSKDELAAKYTCLGLAEFRVKRYKPAFEAWKAAIEQRGSDPILFNNVGVTEFEQGNFDAAADWLQKALSLNTRTTGPDSYEVVKGQYNLFTVYMKQGRKGEAVTIRRDADRTMEKLRQQSGILRNIAGLFRIDLPRTD